MEKEIIVKDVSSSRLTIAPDRISYKIAPRDVPIQDKLVALFDKIVEQVGTPEKTLRGQYNEGHAIRLTYKVWNSETKKRKLVFHSAYDSTI